MNNRELYKAAFSNLHADHTLDLEAMKMKDSEKKTMTGLRCKRGLLVTTLVLIMMLAMTAITYAATDGEIFQTVRVLITSDGSDDGQVHEGTYTVDEDGNYNIQLHEGEKVTVEGDGWTSKADIGNAEGKMTLSEGGTQSTVTIEKITSDEAVNGKPAEDYTPLEDGQELTQDEIKDRMSE